MSSKAGRGPARRINPATGRTVNVDITWERRGLIWVPVYVRDPERDTASPPRWKKYAA